MPFRHFLTCITLDFFCEILSGLGEKKGREYLIIDKAQIFFMSSQINIYISYIDQSNQ